jgi:hypothetical protein
MEVGRDGLKRSLVKGTFLHNHTAPKPFRILADNPGFANVSSRCKYCLGGRRCGLDVGDGERVLGRNGMPLFNIVRLALVLCH